MPTRLYMVLTAAISSGGCARTDRSASANGPSRRESASTTTAPSSHSTPGRTMDSRSGARLNGMLVDIRFRVRGDDPLDALGEGPRIGTGEPRRVDRMVHHELDPPRICGQPPFEHHVPAPDHGDRHNRQAALQGEVEAPAFEPADAAIAA